MPFINKSSTFSYEILNILKKVWGFQKVLDKIDNFLNNITMYRLMLYGLIVLSGVAILFGFLGLLPFNGLELITSLLVILAACWITSSIMVKFFGAATNFESVYITALILFFLLTPSLDTKFLIINFAAGTVSMMTKYIFAVRKKHLFNPAGFAVLLFGLSGISSAIWWGGVEVLLPFTTIIGLLIIRKIRRFQLLFSFFAAAAFSISFSNLQNHISIQESIVQTFIFWPVVFFGTIMLVEPLTSPTRKNWQIIYGILVGIFFGLQFRLGPIFSSPELALIIGNLFAYIVSSKAKLFLSVKEIKQMTPHIYEIIFAKIPSFNFISGQYLEWTLAQKHVDSRGNRRYFTIAAAPTEQDLRIAIRYEDPSSSFKNTLIHLEKNGKISASQLGGDFILPQDQNKKLVFVAGGIGITPFRSMIKDLIDTKQKRDIILFYSNSDAADIVYKDLFDLAAKEIGIKVHYVLTDKEKIPQGWMGITGRLNSEIITEKVSDYKKRIFYLSGPSSMVNGYKKMLYEMGVSPRQIKTDYFPGY